MNRFLRFRPALATTAAVLIALCVPGFLRRDTPILHGYLIGYLFWIGLSLGSLGLLLINHVAGGRWGIVIRRPLEAAASTLPLCALLFIPILAGADGLYEWTHASGDAHIKKISLYLNFPFFAARTALYFAIWIGLAESLRRLSARQDDGTDVSAGFHRLAAPGLLIFILTTTFAFTDWMMSLEPHWFSTIYGIMVLAGHAAGAMSAALIVVFLLRTDDDVQRLWVPKRFNELGNLLLAFVMFWAYLSFSQYLLIWSANISEEVPWVIRRQTGGWQWVAIALLIVHFFGPFFVLLSRNVKRQPARLVAIAGVLLAARWLDLLWLVAPAHRMEGFALHWSDIAALIGVGAAWLWFFLGRLAARRLVPVGDPRLAEAQV